VMSKEAGKKFYQESPVLDLKSLRINADTENLYVKARFETDIPVNGVIIYNDPKTSPADGDYNAVTWATTEIINGDSIFLQMPLAGVDQDYKQFPFDLRLRFCHENGNFTVQNFQYSYADGVPDINISVKEVEELPKDSWSVADFSSEELTGGGEGKGAAINVIDNNTTSFWHSQWYHAKPRYPHFFTIDMNQVNSVNGFVFAKRGDKLNGRPKDITIDVSSDNQKWTSLESFTLNSSTREILELNKAQSFRYFRITIESGHDNEGGEDVFFTHLAEVSVF
jgi:hypothetical protein